MPTYEYRCGKCGHRFDEFQAMSAAPLRKCPECGKAALERLISGGMGILVSGSSSESAGAPCGPGCGCHPPTGGGASAKPPVPGLRSRNGAESTGEKSAGGEKRESSNAGAGDRSTSSSGASTGAGAAAASTGSKSPAPAESSTSSSSSSSASGADPDRAAWKSKATHHSREGRGIGNLGSILKGKGQAAGRGAPAPRRNAPRRRSK